MTELQGTLNKLRKLATEKEPEEIRSCVHLQHRLADLLYDGAEGDELNLNVSQKDFNKTLEFIRNGGRIFKTPEVTTDKPMLTEKAAVTLAPRRDCCFNVDPAMNKHMASDYEVAALHPRCGGNIASQMRSALKKDLPDLNNT